MNSPSDTLLLPRIPVIVGPTASGKSAVALRCALQCKAEILSADSRQVYKFLDIGTAKPSPSDLTAVPHHCIDELLPDQEFTAGDFGTRGREIIASVRTRGRIPLVVGGSGLYVRSLIDGLFEGPAGDKDLREALQRKVNAGLVDDLLDELRRVDPETARRLDRTKPRRIMRALEVFHATGTPISVLHKERRIDVGFVAIQVGLRWEREELYRRIEERCDVMLRAGLLAEVEELERRGFSSEMNALKTVGYAEAFAYRRGEIGYDTMVRLFKQNSRRYAKRQMTWFNADRRIRWIEMNEQRKLEDVAGECLRLFAEGGVT